MSVKDDRGVLVGFVFGVVFAAFMGILMAITHMGEHKSAPFGRRGYYQSLNVWLPAESDPKDGLFICMMRDELFTCVPTSELEENTVELNNKNISI